MNNNKELVLFEYENVKLEVPVTPEQDTVWLNRAQMAELFGRDVKTIGKHIANVMKEELDSEVVVAKFATTTKHGAIKGRTQKHDVEYYNLDVIISVGYRVKSKRGIAFRKWANSVLKQYILSGYAINERRLAQLGSVIKLLKRTAPSLDTNQVLTIVEKYSKALELLDSYDHHDIKRPEGKKATYVLTYDECRDIIDNLAFNQDPELFGKEKDDSFRSSIANIYQSFDNLELYPSLEEKAAHLLYFIVKNHSFHDGNKRIAATIFLYFLDKNNVLFPDGKKLIDDYTLVALTLMVAESKPKEMETMISIIMNCLVRH